MVLIHLTTGRYVRVMNGTNCERVTSKKECEEAARQLRLSDTEAWNETMTHSWPPYCYFSQHGGQHVLYFNEYGNSAAHCKETEKECICKETAGMAHRVFQLFSHLRRILQLIFVKYHFHREYCNLPTIYLHKIQQTQVLKLYIWN